MAMNAAVQTESHRMDRWLSLLIRSLPQPAYVALRRCCYPAILLAQNHRLRLTRLSGEFPPGQASVLVAGSNPWASDLPRRMFGGCPQESDAGEIPVWKTHAVLSELAGTADLVVARVDTLSARLFFGSGYLRVPEWIDAVLPVPADLNSFVRSNHSLREDMRLARKSGLTASISRREEDFDAFFCSMYVPFVRARHGVLAWPSNRESLLKCFRRGGLIWLTQAGEHVAAILFEQIGSVMHLAAMGTRGGDTGLLRNGAVSALFFHSVRHAIECSCSSVDFGGCRPCLTDGVLRFKRKWSVELRVRPLNQFCTLIRWNRWNTAVATFLSSVPVLHEHAGRLTAIGAAALSQPGTQADADRVFRALHIRGVDRIAIVNEAGWSPGITPPSSSVLIGGSPLPEELIKP